MTPERLRRQAERGEMIRDAPVRASAAIIIEAPIGAVWSIMTDVSQWPVWYSYLKHAELHGGFVPGSNLSYGGLVKHRLMVAAVEPRVMAMLCGQMLIYDGITRWDFIAAGARTKVEFTESSSGFLLGALYSEKALREHLENWLAALKVKAERDTARSDKH